MKTLVLALLVVALGCDAEAPGTPPSVTDISQEQLLSNPPKQALILDVRTAEEFSTGHAPNAVNIPHDELASRVEELRSDTARPVVVYCERGERAGKAASVLLDAGYQEVFHLAGDMSEWRANERPTATD